MADIQTDISSISEAGLNKFMSRTSGGASLNSNPFSKYTTATNVSGGTLGKNAVFNVGSELVKIDGPGSKIVVNDGATDRILMGKREDGTFGIDVSSVGYDVNTAYEGEMDLTSSSKDDWIELDPSKFTYSDADTITVATYTPATLFQPGDRIKIVQTTTRYFVIIKVNASSIDVEAGIDYTVANAAITSFHYSKLESPNGFPFRFNAAAVATPAGGTYTVRAGYTDTMKFRVSGQSCTIFPYFAGDLTSDETTVALTLPFPIVNTTGLYFVGPFIPTLFGPQICYFHLYGNSGQSTVTCYQDDNYNGFQSYLFGANSPFTYIY